MSIILPDGTEARSLQEQVIWLTEHNAEPEKYLKEAEVDGNTLTLTNKDGTEVEFTPQTGSAYTAGDGIDITNNEIAVKHGSYLGFDSSNQLTLNNYARTRIEAVDSKSVVSAATAQSPGAATAKSITIDGTAYNLPEGGGGGSYAAGEHISISNNVISAVYQIEVLGAGDA